LYLLITQIYFY